MMNGIPADILVVEDNGKERISAIAVVLGVDRIKVVSLDRESALFCVFPVLSVVSLVMGIRGRHSPASFR
jgi:ABC-type transporter Mla maintaining outer membrane lipid asymmetry permease subunit MlaE